MPLCGQLPIVFVRRTIHAPDYSKYAALFVLLILLSLLSACGGPASTPAPAPAEATTAPAPAEAAPAPAHLGGKRTFVIVPGESKAKFLMNEEFFGGALDKLGIAAGKVDVVGTTQAIAGQLQLDLDNLAAALGDNSFTVKMNTFTTDQPMRDQWIRENGPQFNDYPEATFKATAIEGAPGAYTEGQEVSFKLNGRHDHPRGDAAGYLRRHRQTERRHVHRRRHHPAAALCSSASSRRTSPTH